jgi:creatinine amidohydrolase
VRWDSLTLEEVGTAARGGAVAILPIGATEQHGPHLATGTDTVFADAVAAAAAARTGDVVLPAIPYGCSLGHTARWPGTLSLTPVTLINLVAEVGRWVHASGFRKLVMLNGHATNGPACQSALLQLRHELPEFRLRFISLFDLSPAIAARYAEDAPDFHANEAETSLMLHVDPELVHLDRAVDEEDRTIDRVLQYAVPLVTTSGVVGRPTAATADRGDLLMEQLTTAFAELLRTARAEVDPVLP